MTENGECDGEASFVDIQGKRRHFAVRSYPVQAGKGSVQGTAVLLSDITEKTLLIEKLDTLARTDALTGKLNRRSIFEMGALEVERSRRMGLPLGVLLVDIDLFKSVNDRFGHKAGDRALQATSAIFHGALRSIDILGRYGGEEFLVLLPGADTSASFAAAERCREAVEAGVIPSGKTSIRLTVSIGVYAQIADESSDIEQWIALADAALYKAKESGRNRSCVYEPG